MAIGPLAAAVRATLAEIPGWWLKSRDPAFTEALLEAGATTVRHAHVYSRDLTNIADVETPVLAGEFSWGPIESSAGELGTLSVRAYPPGHPDFESAHPAEADAEIDRLLAGSIVGALIPRASVMIRRGNRVVAVCIVNRAAGEPPVGGPWLTELFRDPDPLCAGLGALVMRRAMLSLAELGERTLGLTVTDTNSADHLYRHLGFSHAFSNWKIAIPDR